MDVGFDYHSPRVAKARLGRHIDKFWRFILFALIVMLVLAGAALVIGGYAVGWFIGSLGAVPTIILAWHNGELRQLALGKTNSLTDTLDAEILSLLPDKPTPADIASAVAKTNGGMFFGARFGVTASLLGDAASGEQVTAEAIFKAALNLREHLNMKEITPGILVVALVQQFPNYEQLLAHGHLTLDDLIEGIRWQEHLNHLIKEQKKVRRTGGIARDWSFGYIPLLARFGQNISEQIAHGGLLNVDIDAHQSALDQLLETFSAEGRQNVALIGPTGAGKTTIVHAFAEKLLDASSKLPSSLKFRQVFILDSSALISAAPGRGELEGLINSVLGEAYAAKNIIICLDNAQLFFEDGVGSVDLSNVLLPILEAGRLRMILTMDEQQFLRISARNSSLANALNRISVGPANQKETMAVMQDQLIITEFSRHVTYMYQSLAEAYRLGERYVHDIAMPGQALKLLESAANYSENGLVTINSVQQAIEQTMNIKVSVASETDDREKLLNMERLIHERMIDQERAVNVVSDALRRARAGVRNENRPIGTFLFLGPTGVGKTELAKALADVYFGGEDRMIRLDLNEFVRNEDVSRLIADGSNDPTSLTAQVMKQPFSVVLLDEIEKAHPAVLTTLLQLLDEGILRDINGREVSFRDAIVIATSNAGADRIRELVTRGYKMEQFEQQFIDELISSNQFRPEFLNRFDEIVLFQPLSKENLLKVVDLMIAGVNKTLALQHISVNVADDAKELLVERGFDPRLGARPMRRVIQKTVENTVAKLLLSGSVSPGTAIDISRATLEQTLGPIEQAGDILRETSQAGDNNGDNKETTSSHEAPSSKAV